jgi:glycosyltransferase involved in cell wall biosynthesis
MSDRRHASPAKLKVSVLMLAYNHAAYIREAVESALRQQTLFDFEIVIGEDCSTDNTREILQRLAQIHPDRIRLELQRANVGGAGNMAATMAACRGEYVAILEGDDCWLGTEKLQRQADFLDAHPDCPLCFHDVFYLDANGAEPRDRFCTPKPARFSTTTDLLQRNFVPTCSVMFRRACAPVMPENFRGLMMTDWPIWTYLSLRGPIAYLDEIWGCYRRHAGGIWTSQTADKQWRHVLRYYEAMLKELPRSFREEAQVRLKAALAMLIETLVATGRWREARPYARRYLLLPPQRFRAPPRRLGLYLRLVFDWPGAVLASSGAGLPPSAL